MRRYNNCDVAIKKKGKNMKKIELYEDELFLIISLLNDEIEKVKNLHELNDFHVSEVKNLLIRHLNLIIQKLSI